MGHIEKRRKRQQPLRVAVVGCGRAAAAHFKAIDYFERKGQLELTALVDRDEAAMERVLGSRRSGAPVPLKARDLGEVLPSRKIDLCVIATPPKTHAPIGLAALNAGAHLIVEKPLTLDREEARALLDTAREKHLKIAVGLKFRHILGVREIKNWLDSGVIGDPLYGSVVVRWGHDQAYYDQAPWFGTWEAEGGALMNQTIHALDLMTWLMGGTSRRATAVLARQRHRMEAADLAFGTLALTGAAETAENTSSDTVSKGAARLLNIEGTTNTRPDVHEASFFIRSEKGTLRASLVGKKISVAAEDDSGRRYEKKLIFSAVKRHLKREGFGYIRELVHPMTFLYADFIDAIDEDRRPLVSGEDGYDALENVLSLFYAAEQGKTVDCPAPSSFSLSDMKGFFDK